MQGRYSVKLYTKHRFNSIWTEALEVIDKTLNDAEDKIDSQLDIENDCWDNNDASGGQDGQDAQHEQDGVVSDAIGALVDIFLPFP